MLFVYLFIDSFPNEIQYFCTILKSSFINLAKKVLIKFAVSFLILNFQDLNSRVKIKKFKMHRLVAK